MNKDGYTLIELLATIVIIGVLATIATVAVYKYITQAKKLSYTEMEDIIYDAAQSYMVEQLPSIAINGSKTLYFNNDSADEDLVKLGYISNLDDPDSDDECSGEVIITRLADTSIGNKVYQYTVKLVCSRYDGGVGVVYPKNK